jgi:chromosome segregation ATPase
MADLIDTLGKKKTEDVAKTVKETATNISDLTAKGRLVRPAEASSLIENQPPKDEVVAKADDEVAGTDTQTEDPTDVAEVIDKDFQDWTPVQFAKALKEARKEAAERRVAAKDLEKRIKNEYDDKLKAIEDKFTPLVKKAEQLDKLKSEEADKKRSLEEKLSHREQVIVDREKEIALIKEEEQTEKQRLQDELHKAKTALEAHETFYKEQLGREIAEVPKKFQKIADSMVKGAENTQEALDLIREAKRENLFGNKKVTVFNGTPGASTGARSGGVETTKAGAANMKSSETIRAGLKGLVTQVKDSRTKFGI